MVGDWTNAEKKMEFKHMLMLHCVIVVGFTRAVSIWGSVLINLVDYLLLESCLSVGLGLQFGGTITNTIEKHNLNKEKVTVLVTR